MLLGNYIRIAWRNMRSRALYQFVDDSFNRMYKAEDQLKRLFDIFTILTIIIAASGLLGLATFSAELRTEEVGVWKVLGANVFQVVVLLSKEFIKLVLVSLVIATPIAWYLSKNWLQQFAYRTEVKWWMFAASAALVLTIAIIAVGGQVLKSALRNPVKSLKITSD